MIKFSFHFLREQKIYCSSGICFSGADVNSADDFGRTPLHVAASADYSEMVRFLIENGADIDLTTNGEKQTPLHFAAKNEAPQSVKILLAYGAELEVRDYKQRTPLQVGSFLLYAVLLFYHFLFCFASFFFILIFLSFLFSFAFSSIVCLRFEFVLSLVRLYLLITRRRCDCDMLCPLKPAYGWVLNIFRYRG